MLKLSTYINTAVAVLLAWSELLLLGDIAAVITRPYLIALIAMGLPLMIISAVQLGSQSGSSFARSGEASVLVQRGFYRHLRHPIYLGIFIVGAAFLLSNPTLLTCLAYALMLVSANVRADLEEHQLEALHPEYTAYRHRTKKYIPRVY